MNSTAQMLIFLFISFAIPVVHAMLLSSIALSWCTVESYSVFISGYMFDGDCCNQIP